ncbi:MAG: chemotaxis protein CheB [Comamonadaceae bacterium]|nr:MAG: chemotaxis protein CheB [Comamonadaceae bacterium]
MSEARNIVVIGAALGGLTAIANIARTWPAGMPAAVLIALATPEQPSPMVLQIIDTYAPVPVAYAAGGEIVRPGRIYLSPPGRHMVVGAEGVLQLEEGSPYDADRPSVNRLFSSAAEVFGSRVIGIVLSGNSRDGVEGLLEIEAAGGVGIAQHPDDAVEAAMPLGALRNGHPRYCVKASAIAPLVQQLMADGEEPPAMRPVFRTAFGGWWAS